MRRGYIFLASIFMLFGVLLIPSVAAHDDAMHVIILLESGPYSQGETVRAQAHVFEKDSYADCNSPPTAYLAIEGYYGPDSYRESEMVRTSQGQYTGEFEIFDSDWMTNDHGYIGLVDGFEVTEDREVAALILDAHEVESAVRHLVDVPGDLRGYDAESRALDPLETDGPIPLGDAKVVHLH